MAVAAGSSTIPIRPVQVEGTYTPPAYLLADAAGHLHTAGADRHDLAIAIPDVREILGHQHIRIAAALWPVEHVFGARLYNPLAAIGAYVQGRPDVVALPFPDDWPEQRVDEYARLVELLGVTVEPLPESVSLSGYARALGLVQPPQPGRVGAGATCVYGDGRACLAVAVHGDEDRPTESVGVSLLPDALTDTQAADNMVLEVMAAARSLGADTSTVLLTGNWCSNDAVRLAFKNHLGYRLHVADHPMHAMVLGAAHLLLDVAADGSDRQPASGPPGPTAATAAPQLPDTPGPVTDRTPPAGAAGPPGTAGPPSAAGSSGIAGASGTTGSPRAGELPWGGVVRQSNAGPTLPAGALRPPQGAYLPPVGIALASADPDDAAGRHAVADTARLTQQSVRPTPGRHSASSDEAGALEGHGRAAGRSRPGGGLAAPQDGQWEPLVSPRPPRTVPSEPQTPQWEPLVPRWPDAGRKR